MLWWAFYTVICTRSKWSEWEKSRANNMANANTFGFRAEKPAWRLFNAKWMVTVMISASSFLKRGQRYRMVSTIKDFRPVAMGGDGAQAGLRHCGATAFRLLCMTRTPESISSTHSGTVLRALSSFQQIKE